MSTFVGINKKRKKKEKKKKLKNAAVPRSLSLEVKSAQGPKINLLTPKINLFSLEPSPLVQEGLFFIQMLAR